MRNGTDIKKYIDKQIDEIKNKVGNKKAICALSGGVDSTVAAVLVHRAIGDQLACIFVDHGLMRKNEGDWVEDLFKNQFKMNFIRINAKDRFFDKLKGIEDPEQKRKIIGEQFIRVFEEESNKLGKFDFLVQGTIYSDVIESGAEGRAGIKSHHNVGGLPEDVDFELIEPLRQLYKDEVRLVGEELDLAHELVWRQPFPGPGLAVRVLGEITEEKVNIVKEADAIVREEIKNAGLEGKIWQYFAVLPNIKSVGVIDGKRSYVHTIAIRAISSVDATTADWFRIPHEVLNTMSTRITKEVKGVNRVVYDITSKPPATVEWE